MIYAEDVCVISLYSTGQNNRGGSVLCTSMFVMSNDLLLLCWLCYLVSSTLEHILNSALYKFIIIIIIKFITIIIFINYVHNSLKTSFYY